MRIPTVLRFTSGHSTSGLLLIVMLLFAAPSGVSAGGWTLPQFMIDYGSDVGDEFEAARNWLEYFKHKQSQPGNVDTVQIDKMVERLEERLRDAPPVDRPPRPPSSRPLSNTADLRAPGARSSQTGLNRTVDIGAKPSTRGGTAAVTDVAEEAAEGFVRRSVGRTTRALGRALPFVDLAIWAMDAYDGATSYLAAQEAFEAEAAAEAQHESLVQSQLLQLYRDHNKDPGRFNSTYTMEELENLVRINLDQGQDPYAGLLAEQSAPPQPLATTPPVTPAVSQEDELARQIMELLASSQPSQPQPLPQPAAVAPNVVEPPPVQPPVTPPVSLPITTQTGGSSGSSSSNLDSLVPPSGPQNPNQLDALRSFMNQLNGGSSSSGSSSASSPSGASGSSVDLESAKGLVQRIQTDPAFRQRLQDASRTAPAGQQGTAMLNVLREGLDNRPQTGGRPAGLGQAIGQGGGARPGGMLGQAIGQGAAGRPGGQIGQAIGQGGTTRPGGQIGQALGQAVGGRTNPPAAAGQNAPRLGSVLPTNRGAQTPAVQTVPTQLQNRFQNRPQNNTPAPGGGLRGRLGNRR